jgi:UPF0755 protein
MKKSFVTFFVAFITWLEIFIVSFIIALTLYLATPIESQKTVYIPNITNQEIIIYLHKKGYDLSIIDYYILRYMGQALHGWVLLGKKEIDRIEFLYKITSKSSHINKITLIPGETLEIFFEDLSYKYVYNKTVLFENYYKYSPYKEAGILPDTYFISQGIREKKLIKYLTRFANNRYKDIAIKEFNDYNITKFNRILTIASIIQKEAATNQEMPKIASVIYNRLKKHMRLQMDGTLNYGKYSHIKVTPKRINDDNSTYNTYKHKGLPKYPVCSTSLNAIHAALHPAKTPYLYFMRNKQGYHDFSTNYKTHRINIQKVKN